MTSAASSLLLACLVVVQDLEEASFDAALRSTPWALVLFHATWSARSKALAGEFARVASSFTDRGLLFGRVEAVESNSELLDRFDLSAFPALLWFDGATKWPFYASEAKPHVYDSGRTFEAIAAFVEQRSGQRRSPERVDVQPEPPVPPPQAEAEAEAASAEADSASATSRHVCTQLSEEYVECMRHRQPCGEQRRRYLLCMSGRWSVDPSKHRALAEEYGRRFA